MQSNIEFLRQLVKEEAAALHPDIVELHQAKDALMHAIAWEANPKIVGEIDELLNDLEMGYDVGH